VPEHRRDETHSYKRKPIAPRRVLEGTAERIRGGQQYFSEWAQAGFFQRMWQEGLTAYDLLAGLGWEW
jgi:hypothetical protein